MTYVTNSTFTVAQPHLSPNEPVVINYYNGPIDAEAKFYIARTVGQAAPLVVPLGILAAIQAWPALLVASAFAVATTAVSHFARNVDTRETPMVDRQVYIPAIQQWRNVPRKGKKQGPARLWRAAQDEKRAAIESGKPWAYGLDLGIEQSPLVKGLGVYPRLAWAAFRDELQMVRALVFDQYGVSFHEARASERLANSGFITPNPRTQFLIETMRRADQQQASTAQPK